MAVERQELWKRVGVGPESVRVVRPDGTVLSDTMWKVRPNNWTELPSLLMANPATGAACMFRRELLSDALPFPPQFGHMFHDHWLAILALSRGRLGYVDRPLYDYVQHGGNVIGHVSTISAIADDEPAESGDTASLGPTMIVFHEAVAARDVLRLITSR